MTGIIICLIVLILLIIGGTILTKKYVKTEKGIKIIFIVSSFATFLCHYSSLVYHGIGHAIDPNQVTSALDFLHSNPNLALPIYPCNIMMIACIIYGFVFDKNNKFSEILGDFIVCFGLLSAVGGMFANADYFNPNVVKNYDIYKSAVAHAIMIYNMLLIPLFGKFKLSAIRNLINTAIGCLGMLIVGLYDTFVVLVLRGVDTVKSYNAMFLIHSPFNVNDKLITFWFVIPLFLIVLFGVLTLLETFMFPNEKRWYNIKKIK